MEMKVSDLLVQMNPTTVLPLGDVQYEGGQYEYFLSGRGPGTGTGYDPSWGRVKSVTRPAVGNHEYLTSGAAGYFDYFNGAGNPTGPAGDRTTGYYSFDIGNWHLVALNSNCSQLGPSGCAVGSAQERWLREDLAAHPRSCQIAYMHHARWASDDDPEDNDRVSVHPLFQALYDHGVELLLVGHSHFYERFAPQNPDRQVDLTGGVRQIIAGTGGRSNERLGPIVPNSEVRNDDTFGVLKLTLHPTSYDWAFVPIAGAFTDRGSSACHRLTPDTRLPSAPDTTPPTAPKLSGAAFNRGFQTKRTFKVSWGDSVDAESGVASYSVTVRRAPFDGGFQPPVEFKTGVPPGSATFTGEPGSTYCFRATATDWDGNISAGTEDCTALPLDNVSFRHRGGWAKKTGNGHYLETFSQTKRLGATLTLPGVQAKHLAMVVAKCPTCGALRVFFRGKLVGRINLRAESMKKLQLVDLSGSGNHQVGTVKVVVTSRGKLIRVDGLGVSAT